MMPRLDFGRGVPDDGPVVGMFRPPISRTRLESSTIFSVLRPTSMSYMHLRAMTTSSYAALPARSPIPVTVVWATEQPEASPRIVLAGPHPKSSWKWVSSGLSMRSRIFLMKYGMACGLVRRTYPPPPERSM